METVSKLAESTPDLAVRLTRASRNGTWDVHTRFEWPEALEQDRWYMPPEMISIYGTGTYDAFDEAQQKKLSLYEISNFFSFVLHGEQPLVQGLVHRLYHKKNPFTITQYLHHFVDEENKHMVMFGEFCNRYVGKVYQDKKVAFPPRKYAKGEEDVAFYCMVMVVEELGDFYNVTIAKDERVDATVRKINRVHHVDEARHLAFGRRHLADLFEEYSPGWNEEQLDTFRTWLVNYIKSCWGDYYNPSMYKDAGLEDSYNIRQMALSHPVCATYRKRVSSKLLEYFVKHGILAEAPSL